MYCAKISAWTTHSNHLLVIITVSNPERQLPERRKRDKENNLHWSVVFRLHSQGQNTPVASLRVQTVLYPSTQSFPKLEEQLRL